jgi:hypothetical protein
MLAGNFTANVLVSGKAVTLDGVGATLTSPANQHPLDIEASSNVHVIGLSIVDTNTTAGSGGAAVICNGSSLRLEAVSIDAQQCGINAACTLTMFQSSVRVRTNANLNSPILNSSDTVVDRSLFNGGDALLALGGTATTHVTNSVFTNMTGPDGAFAGLAAFGGPTGSMTVSFSTIINSNMLCVHGVPTCEGGTLGGSCIDSAVFFNNGPGAPANTLGDTSCVANFSLIFPQSTTPSGANNTIALDPQLKDPANGDFHLTTNSAAVDAADPAAIPTPDFDGTPRPQGMRSDMGAFELKP